MRFATQFNKGDASKLRRFLNSVSDKRTYVRVLAVCLLAEGHSIGVVCSQLSVDRRSLYRWVSRFLAHHNWEDLVDKPRSGRPVISANLSDRQILNLIGKDPRSFGYMHTAWTVGILAHHLAQSRNIHLSISTLRRRMKAIGLRYKLPKYVYEEKEPNRAQKKGRSSESCASGRLGPS